MKEMHAIFTGSVQAVGFRASTVVLAKALNLVGQVRNLSNGSVEVIAQGSEADLSKLVNELKQMFSAQAKIELKEKSRAFSEFSIG